MRLSSNRYTVVLSALVAVAFSGSNAAWAAEECPGFSRPTIGQIDARAIVLAGSAWENPAWMASLRQGLATAERLIGLKINVEWVADHRPGGAELFNVLTGPRGEFDARQDHVAFVNSVGASDLVTMIFGGVPRTFAMDLDDWWWNANSYPKRPGGVAFRPGDWSRVPIRFHALALSSYRAPSDPNYYGRMLAHELVHAVAGVGHSSNPQDLMWGGAPLACQLFAADAQKLSESRLVRPL